MQKTGAQVAERDAHMQNAADYAVQVCDAAELRGLTGYQVAVSFASVLAARNPTLAGKVLVAVMDAIQRQPITNIAKVN